MTSIDSGPWLISALIGSLIFILVWSIPRMSDNRTLQTDPAKRADVLQVLMIFASFAAGVFVTYMFLGLSI